MWTTCSKTERVQSSTKSHRRMRGQIGQVGTPGKCSHPVTRRSANVTPLRGGAQAAKPSLRGGVVGAAGTPATLLRCRDARLPAAAPPPGGRTSRALAEEIMGEENLSAQEAQADAHPRVSGSDVDPSRPGRDQVAASQGPPQADRLIWRIRDRTTFDVLGSAPRRRRGPVSLTVVVSHREEPPRVAYAVGKRVGPAVVRNRVRRRLRASVARHRDALRPGAAYLVGAGPAAAAAPFAELDSAVGALLVAAGRP